MTSPATPRRFDTLGFSPAYSCQVDPEFPGSGDWGDPQYRFQSDGPASEPFHSWLGAPLIARFSPAGAGRWVGFFEAGSDRDDAGGVFACPTPTQALVVSGGQAYLVDVTAPSRSIVLGLTSVTQVSRVEGAELIVLATALSLGALGPSGLVWESEHGYWLSVRVEAASVDGIRCVASFFGGDHPQTFTVDPRTGGRLQDP
jgi:hypothetical protein